MIKAIIFDCFGVLTTDGWLAFKQRYLVPGSEAEVEATELNHRVDAKLISLHEFVEGIARLGGVSQEQAVQQLNTHTSNDALFEFIRDNLKSRYKIGLCSNAYADYTQELFTPEQNALFDAKTFSFELGVVKPDAAMYEAVATKLGVSTEECLFIDDRESFVAGARLAGMRAVWFQSNEQLTHELQGILNA